MNWIDLVFPKRCVLCHCAIAGKGEICPSCAQSVREKYQWNEAVDVQGCTQTKIVLAYQEQIRRVLVQCKYSNRVSIGKWAGGQIAACFLRNQPNWQVDLITYVPTTLGHWWKRGFNLSKILAERTGKIAQIPCQKTLHRNWFGQSQLKQRTKAQRISNAQNTYFPRKGLDLSGKKIVLIDDILTTGATASVCATILRQMGAKEVYLVCLAKAVNDAKK